MCFKSSYNFDGQILQVSFSHPFSHFSITLICLTALLFIPGGIMYQSFKHWLLFCCRVWLFQKSGMAKQILNLTSKRRLLGLLAPGRGDYLPCLCSKRYGGCVMDVGFKTTLSAECASAETVIETSSGWETCVLFVCVCLSVCLSVRVHPHAQMCAPDRLSVGAYMCLCVCVCLLRFKHSGQ